MAEGSISHSLVRRVAAEKGVEPTVLTPLYQVIDTDALDALFDGSDGAILRDGHVAFTYEGYTVRVDHDHSISLEPSGD